MGTHGTANTRILRRCPPKAQEDGRNAASTGHGDRCSFRARMRSVTLAPTMTASQTGNPSSPSRSVRGRGGRSHAAGDARSRFGRTHPLYGRRLPASSCGGGCSTSEGHEPSDDGGRSSKRFPEGRRSGDVGGAGTKNTYQPRQSMRVVARAKPETRRCFEP